MNVKSGGQPRLAIRGAGKRYGDVVALQDCSFDVEEQSIVAIVGPSGCGKTTLLWSMSGLHNLTEGEILLDGVPVTAPRAEIGLVFQQANLLPWRNLMQNVLFPYEIKRIAPDRQWITHLIERVGLSGFETRMPGHLSGGMQQRAAIVRALSQKPEVLLMDEPFGALDAFTREEMNILVEEIWAETRTTIVFITHSIEEALFLADKVVVMSGRPGRVHKEYLIDLPRPRSPEIMAGQKVFDLTHAIKGDIYGFSGGSAPANAAE